MRPWLIGSLVVAGLGFVVLLFPAAVQGGDIVSDVLFTVGVVCPVVWCVLVGAAIYAIGRRALWLLLGAPVALFWPVFVVLTPKPVPDPVISCQDLPPQETQQVQALLSQSAGRPVQVTMVPCAPGS